MTARNALSPIERAVQVWNARPSGNYGWYSAHCTGHDDKSASLSIIEQDSGRVWLQCHAGCSRESILAGAALTEKELSPKGTYRVKYTPRPKYDLISLAAAKLLPWQLLFNEGVIDGYKWHGMEVIQITYYSFDGEEYSKVRVRTGPSGNKDSYWDEDTPGLLIPYGLHKLAMAREAGYLLIGEGESDAWTCWYHGTPYLGVPGATATQCLDGALLNDIPALYIIQEPDKAGQEFYRRCHKQLRATGYTGQMYALPWQKLTGWKDPNELHRMIRLKDPNDTHAGFQAAISSALERATPAGDDIELSVSRMDEQEWVPRREYEELEQKYHDVRTQRDFMLQNIAVPEGTMQSSDKAVNAVIDHHIRTHAPNAKGFTSLNMKEIARLTGLGYKTVLECKKHLIEKMRLYEQDTVSFYHTDSDGKTKKTHETISLRPTQAQSYPRLYDSTHPILRGGKQKKKERPTCPQCGSENVDTYHSTLCHHCHDYTNEPITKTELAPASFRKTTEVEALPATVQEDVEGARTEVQTPMCQLDTGITTREEQCQLDTGPRENTDVAANTSQMHPHLTLIDSTPVFVGTDEEYRDYRRQAALREVQEKDRREIARKSQKAKVQAG